MTGIDSLEPELVWQEDGHLGDVAVTAIADGELDLVPASAHAHAAVCDACNARIGEAALLSLDVDAALGPARRPLPVAAIAAALVVAVLGMAPLAGALARRAVSALALFTTNLPLLARAAASLARGVASHAAGVWPFAWLGASMLLFMTGLAIAHLAPRRAVTDGGTR